MDNSLKSSSVYTLETPDERKMRMIITAVMVAAFLLIGYVMLPFLTKMIRNWIDFGIEMGKLLIMVGIVGTIILMRNVLIARYKSAVRKLTRFLIKTDLPGLLEVVVANRRGVLAKFNASIKKMMTAITLHTRRWWNVKIPCKKISTMPHSLENRPTIQRRISIFAIRQKTR